MSSALASTIESIRDQQEKEMKREHWQRTNKDVLKQYTQNGWDIDDFRLVFGKSYLQTAEERAVCTPDGNMSGVDEDPGEVPA